MPVWIDVELELASGAILDSVGVPPVVPHHRNLPPVRVCHRPQLTVGGRLGVGHGVQGRPSHDIPSKHVLTVLVENVGLLRSY